jgi:hypothetical protein
MKPKKLENYVPGTGSVSKSIVYPRLMQTEK